jgi:hypothetical protein
MIIKTTINQLQTLITLFLLGVNLCSAQTNLPYTTDFESDSAGWIDGGGDSQRVTNNGNSPKGSDSWEIKDNSGNASAFYQNFDLTNYSTITISFSFESNGFDNSGDSFEVYLDNNTILTYKFSEDWQNNGNVYNATITLSTKEYVFTNNSEIRFETVGLTADNDRLYIDEISITGEIISSSLQALFSENFEDETQGDSNGIDLYGTAWNVLDDSNANRFEVRNGKYFEADETDGPAKWVTNSINIIGYTSLKLSANINFGSGLDNGSTFGNLDYIKFIYKIDNGAPIEIASYNGINNNGDYTWDLTNVTGNTLELIIEFKSDNNNNEIHRIDNINLSGTAPAIWRNQKWVNKIEPTLDISAIIDDNYETKNNGNFSCKDLTINTGYKLFINNKTYIEVKNNTKVNGELEVETEGAFLQINDDAIFTGIGTVTKTTPMKKAWHYYNYWGSPVKDMTINSAFPLVPSNRRFYYNAQNFLDLNGDNFDDNGDDWQIAPGNSVMTPGIGYACTSSTSYVFPKNDIISFRGAFNNGIVSTQIAYTGDSNSLDHPNLIGNPYASAVDFNEFYYLNSALVEGVAYYWSQATPANNNGKFSINDYATYSVGLQSGVSGASKKTPNQFLPSGQAIFITAKKNGTVVFNNSMRVKGINDNSQFFKSTNSKSQNSNKLWLDLTSDNGVYSQVLIGYVDGATNENDGLMYDAPKLAAGEASVLYSIIKNSSKKFVIQGKDINSLDNDEVILLGFKTKITESTIYSISIAQFQGDFLTNNTIYLKDNLLNKVHNLSDSSYMFTSEIGEFNDRFVVMFNNQSLSTDELFADANTLKIIDIDNDLVKFTTNNSLIIKNVSVFDLLGRQLYQFKGQNSTETYLLSGLKNSIYIAKVELSNGSVITKKAIKE